MRGFFLCNIVEGGCGLEPSRIEACKRVVKIVKKKSLYYVRNALLMCGLYCTYPTETLIHKPKLKASSDSGICLLGVEPDIPKRIIR